MASFLLHFTSFTEWPEKQYPGIKICLVGENPFATYINEMVSVRPTNRSGEKIIITPLAVGENVSRCNLIFIKENSITNDFWDSLPKQHSILLVSEFSDFVKQGGAIAFYSENKRIRLNINIDAVKDAGLSMSSELLKLAKITKEVTRSSR